MFRFEHPEYLWLLISIPICLGFFAISIMAYKKAMSRYAQSVIWGRLMPAYSRNKGWIKTSLFALGLTFLIIAMANPQWGLKKEKVNAMSSDIMLALDISNSMMASDVAPNRLSKAKRIAEEIILNLKGERVGIIIFAGNAYLQMPLTLDYAAAILFVKSANTQLATTQGTAFTEVFDLAERAFDPEDIAQKALIVITDGEDHEEDALERTEQLKEKGIVLFTVGVATESGGLVPIQVSGREDYLRDENGQPVRTILNENLLSSLANNTDGAYYYWSQEAEIPKLIAERIARLEKKQVEQRSFTEYESYYQYFLFFGMCLLIAEVLIPHRKSSWFKKRDWYNV